MEIRDFFKNLSPEKIAELNYKQFEEAEKEHNEFLNALEKGCCYLCGMKLSYFNESEECLHWFLLPDGIRKKHFDNFLAKKIGYFQLESYLRWMANSVENIKNINDLKNENPNGKLIEDTIKFKNIEWSINFGITDLEGHTNSNNANFPHFHIQIFKDNLPFIRFNDYHVPFSKHDLFKLESIRNSDLVEHLYLHGEGISVIENENELKWFDEKMVPCKNEDEATFHTRSLFIIPNEESITVEQLNNLKQVAKEKAIPVRKYIKELIPNVIIYSKVHPGKGVVKKKTRNKRKK